MNCTDEKQTERVRFLQLTDAAETVHPVVKVENVLERNIVRNK